jgi:CubicO group peptidase (beta-lactamase class C family)
MNSPTRSVAEFTNLAHAPRSFLRRVTAKGSGIFSQKGSGAFIPSVRLAVVTVSLCFGALAEQSEPPARPAEQGQGLKRKQEERRRFQDEELITARPFTFIFNPGDPPRIVWRDLDEVRRLGCDGRLRVRWFDADLNETANPTRPGRWGALIEATAPNGTPVRRAMTLFCRPPGFLFLLFPASFTVPLAHVPGPISSAVWSEHEAEFADVSRNSLFKALNDTEAATILLAGLSGTKPLGRAPLSVESAAALNNDFHLKLKLKVLGLEGQVHSPALPRKRATPAPALRVGTSGEAGMRSGAAASIRAVCAAWAKDSGEPFVTLVARNGVIVIHEAFGHGPDDRPVGLDYRCDVASITKSATAILFSQFLDQGLIGLDDPVSTVFADYPPKNTHVPTFRQCLTHMSGLSGHGDWGGVRNPHLENIVLNGIDVNLPGKSYVYSGMGFDLTGKAMEIKSGESALRLYRDHLLGPLGMGDVPLENASAGARFTARELGILAQWLANRGSYGELEFVTPATFAALLPEPLGRRYPGVTEEEGIGMHWMRHLRPGAKPGSTRAEDLLFSPNTVGHGSFSACIFLADLDRALVVAQVRKAPGPRYAEWSIRFYQAIVDGAISRDRAASPSGTVEREIPQSAQPPR